jgi:hypothetical protein
LIEKEKELYLQHRLEIKRLEREKELDFDYDAILSEEKSSKQTDDLAERISFLENQVAQLLGGKKDE